MWGSGSRATTSTPRLTNARVALPVPAPTSTALRHRTAGVREGPVHHLVRVARAGTARSSPRMSRTAGPEAWRKRTCLPSTQAGGADTPRDRTELSARPVILGDMDLGTTLSLLVMLLVGIALGAVVGVLLARSARSSSTRPATGTPWHRRRAARPRRPSSATASTGSTTSCATWRSTVSRGRASCASRSTTSGTPPTCCAARRPRCPRRCASRRSAAGGVSCTCAGSSSSPAWWTAATSPSS